MTTLRRLIRGLGQENRVRPTYLAFLGGAIQSAFQDLKNFRGIFDNS